MSTGEQPEHLDLPGGEPGRPFAAGRGAMAGSPEHGVDSLAVQAPGLRLVAQLGDRGRRRRRAPVCTGLGHRVVDVGRGEHAVGRREVRGGEPRRISGAVEALAIASREPADAGERG